MKFYYLYKALAHPEKDGFVQPYTLEERLLHVKEAERMLDTGITWLCDGIGNDAKHKMGNAPNSEFIVGPDGKVCYQHQKNIVLHVEHSTTPHDVYDDWIAEHGDSLEAFFPVAKTEIGNIAGTVGVEGAFPESYRAFAMNGAEIQSLPSYKVAQIGLGLVPEGRQIFPNLSVRENLIATATNRVGSADPWTLDKVFGMFPGLAARRTSMGNELSGGEQQMLAIGRALMTNPRLLILDEATEGLAPLIREEIWRCLESLKTAGQSILVIDKNVDALTRIADRHYVIEKGLVVWSGTSAELRADDEILRRYLGV